MTPTLEPFKRGDTPTFYLEFISPVTGYDWSGVTVDAILTSVEAPQNNDGAAAIRLNQALTPNVANTGVGYAFTLTIVESKALTVNSTYIVEGQLKQGATSVLTPVTAKVKVTQDFII